MCDFVWTARSGQEHRCVREHRSPGPVMHVCECGANIYPNRPHPEGHAAYVARAARKQNNLSRATATRINQPWTPEEDLKLRELAASGEPVSAVARELGRTIQGVRGRSRGLGVHVGPKSQGILHPGVARPEQEV